MKKKFGLFIIALLVFVAVVSKTLAGGETTLLVGAFRDDITLDVFVEPTSNQVLFYVDGDPVEYQTTIEWYGNAASGYNAIIQDTVSWSAFKLNNVDYIVEIDGLHWIDDPNDETGWMIRQEVNPTLEMAGTGSQMELVLNEGWGEENIVFYTTETPGEQTFDLIWEESITGKVLWSLTLDDVSNWTAFKIVATEFTPEVLVQSVNSNCWHDVGGGWVEKTTDCPALGNQTFLPIIKN